MIYVDVPQFKMLSGRTFYTLHDKQFAGHSFNPNTNPGSSGRFHPFTSKSGNIVPTLYLADCVNGAFFEVLFRKDGSNIILGEDIERRCLSYVETTKDIMVADFTLIGDKHPLFQPLNGGKEFYHLTRIISKIVHDEMNVGGITWNSVQIGMSGITNIVLFGDKVANDSVVTKNTFSLANADGETYLRRAANAAGITITLPGN